MGTIVVGLWAGGAFIGNMVDQGISKEYAEGEIIALVEPARSSPMSVEQALWGRRSVRQYRDEALTLDQVSQLLWAALGVSDAAGHRTAPSAGGLYPLEVYLVAGKVDDLEAGVYHYLPREHSIVRVTSGDIRAAIASAALDQRWMQDAPVILMIAAVYERTQVKYGDRTVRYVNMEVGAAAQNVYLQAESLGLGTVMVGAFYELRVQSAMELEEDVVPLALMPVGKK